MQNQRLPILVYHHVYPDADAAKLGRSAGVIGVSEFRRQMNWIRHNGWQVISTSAVVDWLDGRSIPARACSIHFDNGWLDTYTVALPVMKNFGMTATCFPITSGIEAALAGGSIRVRTLTEGHVEHPFLNWEQLGQLREAGWELGAHTHSHCKMADKLVSEGKPGVLREVEDSHRLFGKHLGVVPQHFAYPSGSRTTLTDELLAPYYRSLRLWRWEEPIRWVFTDQSTSHLGVECQNVDARVSFADFQRILSEALNTSSDS